jgi:hypothetical protein
MKFEIRISKSETNPKFESQNPKLFLYVSVIDILDIRAYFGFRISCFGFLGVRDASLGNGH